MSHMPWLTVLRLMLVNLGCLTDANPHPQVTFLVGVPVFVEMGVKARWGKHEGPFDYAGVKQ